MKASVQYNDFRGTVAADISDFHMNSLQNFLEKTYKSYDCKRYMCEGCTLWISERGHVNMTFICFDKIENKHVRFEPQNYMSYEEAFSLFKRFEIVMGNSAIDDIEIDESEERITLQ